MKKFEFKLQKLLEIREANEREIQGELAKLISAQIAERLKRKEYKYRIAKERDTFCSRLKSGEYSFIDALNYGRFVNFSEKVIDSSDEKIRNLEPDVQEVRERLIEASKERKVVERLKERKWKQYLYESNREIVKENDDANQKIYPNRRTGINKLESLI